MIRNGLFSNNPADIARTYLADVQRKELKYDYSDFGLCISCIQTDRLEALAQVLRLALPHSKLSNRNSPVMKVTEEVDGEQRQTEVLNSRHIASFSIIVHTTTMHCRPCVVCYLLSGMQWLSKRSTGL